MDFSDVSVLCVGDVMLDRFVHGDIERISPEAPVPVIRLRQTREMLGGAGNVASNIASLGGRAVLVGLVGRDAPARHTRLLAARAPSRRAWCPAATGPPSARPASSPAASRWCAPTTRARAAAPARRTRAARAATRELPGARAVILSDYGKGVLSRAWSPG